MSQLKKSQVSVSLSSHLHIYIPDARLCMAHCSSLADDVTNKDAHVGYFQVKDMQVASSLTQQADDIRFTLGSVSAVILRGGCAHSGRGSGEIERQRKPFSLLRPVPPTAILMFSHERALQTKVFRAWCTVVHDHAHHFKNQTHERSLDYHPAQIYGHVSMTENTRAVSVVSSFLVLSLDDKVLQHSLEFVRDNLDALRKVRLTLYFFWSVQIYMIASCWFHEYFAGRWFA